MRQSLRVANHQAPSLPARFVLAFDAYGTLFDTGTGSVDATTKILARYDTQVSPAEFYTVWKSHNLRMELERRDFQTEVTLFQIGLELAFNDFGIDGDAAHDIELILATQGQRAAYGDVAETLSRLAGHVRVVIASNSDTAPLHANVERAGLAVDDVISSEDLRAYKPNPRFYERLLEHLDIRADQMVFVGDTLETDVLGPRRAGIESIWLRRDRTAHLGVTGEPSAADLAEVEELLRARRIVTG